MNRFIASPILFLTALSFSFETMAQIKFDYNKAWKQVEMQIDNGLPKSALEETDKIYAAAKKDKNDPQLLKTIIYKGGLISQVEENDWWKNLQLLESEASSFVAPARQVVYGITADLYWQYFQNQRYKIYNRTNTSGTFIKTDPDTWTIDDFHKTIQRYYGLSLTEPKKLQATPVSAFDTIVVKGNQRALRPTLYDLLAHKALEYYKNPEVSVSQPAYKFELNDYASLSASRLFIRHAYNSPDSSSNGLAAIRLYQDLITFHLKDADPAALIDVDIDRLKYAYANGVMEQKEQMYKEALEHIFYTYNKAEQATQAGYLLAQWWSAKADNYQPGIGTKTDAAAYGIAADIAREAIKRFPKSEGGINAGNLLRNLEKPILTVLTENVNVPGQPFRALVHFRNVQQFTARIVRITAKEEAELSQQQYRYGNQENWSWMAGLSAIKSWQQKLPATTDLREHSAEVKVDGMPVGKYLLLLSGKDDFSMSKNPMAAIIFHVSDISYVSNGVDYFILNRSSGQPLSGAKVGIWESHYDYNLRKNIKTKKTDLVSDKNGRISVPQPKKETGRPIQLEVSHQSDYLFLEDAAYARPLEFYDGADDRKDYDFALEEDRTDFAQEHARYFIFTDRSLYRPGQSVFFKAIGITRNKDNFKSALYLPKEPVTIELYDVNGQAVDSMSLIPNDFGSIAGQFKLPPGGLTGDFNIRIMIKESSYAYFKVEEYKRPKFFAEIQIPEGSYKLNDSVEVKGFARAYAGNAIDGAKVEYRVYRATRFLYPWLFWRHSRIMPPFGQQSRMELVHGSTVTGANGSFTVRFKALPDLSVNKDLSPTFDYIVEASVIDINGETREATQTVSVGYRSLLLNIGSTGGLYQQKGNIKPIQVSTTNLQGKARPNVVTLTLHKLVVPKRDIRERYWEQPDTSVMTEVEFTRLFPTDPYANENDYKTWAKEKQIWQATLQDDSSKAKVMLPSNLEAGWYIAEAKATDKDGQAIEAQYYFAVADHKNQALPGATIAYQPATAMSIEPGETAVFAQGTSASSLHIIQQSLKKQNNQGIVGAYEYLKLTKGIQEYSFPATEDDRGGYAINRMFVYNNRWYTSQWQVMVPWTNKMLKIELQTFRNKLLPGQQETWSVKISGAKGEQVATEMLASMYDASLDQIYPHQWATPGIWTNNYFEQSFGAASNFQVGRGFQMNESYNPMLYPKVYDRLLTIRSAQRMMMRSMAAPMQASELSEDMATRELSGKISGVAVADSSAMNEVVVMGYGIAKPEDKEATPPVNNEAVQIRKNFNETAFFLPQMRTNEKGEISFDFTIPEALTQWKLQMLAHTRLLALGSANASTVTQKELMVQPNAPRFFRQGDNMELVTKLVNMSAKEMTGTVSLELLNPATMTPVDGWLKNVFPNQYFTVPAGQSVAVKFPMEIPVQYTDALMYRIVAKAADSASQLIASDGEEMALPVLSNRMLVTESFPLNMQGVKTKQFDWTKLKQSGSSPTLQHQSLTVEYTSNPAWYAVQALPYLMEYPYDCSEQTWNRFYANALAGRIVHSIPRIKAVFESWKGKDSQALISNLQKNQELKAVLLEETPWVLAAKTETEQKKNIALLFDLVRMSAEAEKALAKLTELQSPNGGFVWFKGGPDDRYMTQYIITGMGHLKKMNAWPEKSQQSLQSMVQKAMPYLDARIQDDYNEMIRNKSDLSLNHLSSMVVQYLYMRSFFPEVIMQKRHETSYKFYMQQAKKYWTKQGKYEQGMIALALHRSKDAATPKAILASLKENSIQSEEFGMYWKEFNNPGYYWWQAPIESQALLIEAFAEIENHTPTVDKLKTWLLKQKQTQNWKTTKATADACYALLLQGTDWLQADPEVTIVLGSYTIDSKSQPGAEAGTGYFKHIIAGEKLSADMGNIKVTVAPAKSSNATGQTKSATSWGAAYWQYFEDLDKITPAATPLKIKKQLFIKKNTDRGPVLQPIAEGGAIKVGDKVTVRVELYSDRSMEYVHLKDMRASCFEPVAALSGYKYQDGLGYYESIRDASMNFFMGYLPKGTYVFEYDMTATLAGNFSNGITTIQCMYAPEFSSHSQGIRVEVK